MSTSAPPEPQFTDDARRRILELVKTTMEPERAASALGVTSRTFRRWGRMAASEQHRRAEGLRPRSTFTPYVDFAAALQIAIGEAESILVLRLQQAARGGAGKTTVKTEPNGDQTTTTETEPPKWQSAAWLLERRWPERYQQHSALSVTDMSTIAADVVAVIGDVLDDPALGLTPELRAKGRDLAVRRLMAEANEGESAYPG